MNMKRCCFGYGLKYTNLFEDLHRYIAIVHGAIDNYIYLLTPLCDVPDEPFHPHGLFLSSTLKSLGVSGRWFGGWVSSSPWSVSCPAAHSARGETRAGSNAATPSLSLSLTQKKYFIFLFWCLRLLDVLLFSFSLVSSLVVELSSRCHWLVSFFFYFIFIFWFALLAPANTSHCCAEKTRGGTMRWVTLFCALIGQTWKNAPTRTAITRK